MGWFKKQFSSPLEDLTGISPLDGIDAMITCPPFDSFEEEVWASLQDSSKISDGGSTPSQYGIPEGATDLQDLIEYRDMNFALGNIFKACYRYGQKNDNMYELNKMKWFIDRLIKEEENK